MHRPLCFFLLLSCLATAQARADLIGSWQFNGNLDNSVTTSTAALMPLDVTFDMDLNPIYGTWTTNYVQADINGSDATVLVFPDFGPYQALTLINPLGTNGGPYLNTWTIGMDVSFPVFSPTMYTSLFQTNPDNANDGDMFIYQDGSVGISGVYDAPGSVVEGEWHRIVITATVNNVIEVTLDKYVDGVHIGSNNGGFIDGRYGLENWVHLFADDDGENASGLINSLVFFDEPLSLAQVADLGGATAQGIVVVPEPDSLWLLATAALVILLRHRCSTLLKKMGLHAARCLPTRPGQVPPLSADAGRNPAATGIRQ